MATATVVSLELTARRKLGLTDVNPDQCWLEADTLTGPGLSSVSSAGLEQID
jgi:hypothetical protein